MGSRHALADPAPQQELPPECTRSAAAAYFSRTTSLMVSMKATCKSEESFRAESPCSACSIPRRERKAVPEAHERSLPLHANQVLVSELVQMMRESRGRNVQLRLDLIHNHSFRMGGKQRAQDPEPGLGPERREHVGVPGNLPAAFLCGDHSILL